MIRWSLLVVGLAMVVLSAIAHFKQPPLPSTPRKVTLAEAVSLTSASNKEYVSLEAALDRAVKIYSTPTTRPVYAACATDKTHPILGSASGGADHLAAHVGCFVRAERTTQKSFIALQTVKPKALQEAEVVGERILAPLQGTELKVWVISKPFAGDNAGLKQAWLAQGSFEGALSRLEDFEANVTHPALSHDWAELRAFVQKEFAVELPEDAWLIVTDSKWDFAPLYYSPVRGSENTLFVPLTQKSEAALPSVLTGVLEPVDLKQYQDFASVLPQSPPQRIGILRLQTAEAFNERQASNVLDMLLIGGICVFLGSLGILWRRVRRGAGGGRTLS